jgi:cellulose synthase/poly-beta-1,6-N-acetylglucosamine synthase-like glycosyltransferase
MKIVAEVVFLLAIGYYLIQNAIFFLLLLSAIPELRRARLAVRLSRIPPSFPNDMLPRVEVLVPAYNEEVSIVRTVHSLIRQSYPNLSILVISDGSKDGTVEALTEAFDLEEIDLPAAGKLLHAPVRSAYRSRALPRLKVIDKENGGKADSLNCGLDHTDADLFAAIDADVIMDPDGIERLVVPFLQDPDNTMITCGAIRLRNGSDTSPEGIIRLGFPHRFIEAMQIVEYLRAFTVGRMGWNRFNAHVIVSGAFGLFRRDAVLEIGGYQPFAIGEDMELTVRLHRKRREQGRPCRVTFHAEAVCYTEAPNRWPELIRQRVRWQQGLLTSLRVHGRMVGNPRYGAVGLFALPYFLLFELLSPAFELFGYITTPVLFAVGLISLRDLLAFTLIAIFTGSIATLCAIFAETVLLDRYHGRNATLRMIGCALVEGLGYHQYLGFHRLKGMRDYKKKLHIRGGWKPPERLAK